MEKCNIKFNRIMVQFSRFGPAGTTRSPPSHEDMTIMRRILQSLLRKYQAIPMVMSTNSKPKDVAKSSGSPLPVYESNTAA
jgi:hypothetical protein